MTTEVHVFADWEEFKEPALVGTLRSSVIRQKEHFSFSYDTDWLQSPYARQIDPALNLYSGEQHGLHFTSAMTQLGYYDGDYEASYLELAQFLTEHGSNSKEDLTQLWRRIVYYIAISNTDDHLKNHGFIYHQGGWLLSPAYDINPVTPANGLQLNISDNDNRLNYDIALEVIEFFQLNRQQALKIKDEVLASVAKWRSVASAIGIGRREQQLMESAFNL